FVHHFVKMRSPGGGARAPTGVGRRRRTDCGPAPRPLPARIRYAPTLRVGLEGLGYSVVPLRYRRGYDASAPCQRPAQSERRAIPSREDTRHEQLIRPETRQKDPDPADEQPQSSEVVVSELEDDEWQD